MEFVYFNARGRGEKVRWTLAQSGAEWKDRRMVDGEWATLKPSEYLNVLHNCKWYIIVAIHDAPTLDCRNLGRPSNPFNNSS